MQQKMNPILSTNEWINLKYFLLNLLWYVCTHYVSRKIKNIIAKYIEILNCVLKCFRICVSKNRIHYIAYHKNRIPIP